MNVIEKALKDIETAEVCNSEVSSDYHVRKAHTLALIAIAVEMEKANRLKEIENDIRNKTMWKMK